MTTPLTKEDRQEKTGILVSIGLLILVFGFTILLAYPAPVLRSNPVWFIGMLIIFGASMGLMAVVFSWLGLQAPGEAFGLPSGSIRTLLAIGVMVLFAVFGLAAISTDEGSQRPSDQPLPTVAIVNGDTAVVQAEIKRYKALNVVAVPASISASGAELKLYRMESFRSQEATDLQKQIITALVTLLTSVVSFYFGSRTVEAARNAQTSKGGDTPPTLPDAVASDIAGLDTTLDALRKRLAALKSAKASEGSDAALATQLSQASADLATAEASRTQIAAGVKDLATGTPTVDALTAAVAALKTSLSSLGDLLTQAEALVTTD